MNFSKNDIALMKQCLQLAAKAEGGTSPNPMVGSIVLDKKGNEVGRGFHKGAGLPHAEVESLTVAGNKAEGGTLYVNLEPCSHFGRTPPCSDLIIKSGITKVYAATTDTNPKVDGEGFSKLKKHGIEVSIGLLEEEARWLNRSFFKSQKTGLPWLTLKLASTLDGRIADRYGNSKWITGEESRHFVQELRHKNDCVLIGAHTARKDNPRLNVRELKNANQPVRAIIDPHLSLEKGSHLLDCPSSGKTIFYCLKSAASKQAKKSSQYNSVTLVPIEEELDNRLNLESILKDLNKRGINSVLCEGGSNLSSQLLKQGLIDEIYWFVAPKLLPDSKSLASTGGEEPLKMEDVLQFNLIESFTLNEDTLIHLKNRSY